MQLTNEGVRVKQSLLTIRFPQPADSIRASTFREMLARELNGVAGAAEAFHYSESGKPLPGLLHDGSGKLIGRHEPNLRVVGGKSWVGLLSMKEDDPMFNALLPAAMRVASVHYDAPLQMQISNPEFGLIETDRPHVYYLRDMALRLRPTGEGKKTNRLTKERVQQWLEKDAADLAKERVLRWLRDRCAIYGIDLPCDDRINMVVHEANRMGMRMRTSHGETGQFITLINAEFSLNANLGGIWQVGGLQTRGYGRIIRKGDWN